MIVTTYEPLRDGPSGSQLVLSMSYSLKSVTSRPREGVTASWIQCHD